VERLVTLALSAYEMKDDQEQKFIADLRGEDVLGVVLRPHIYVEEQLERLLDALVPYPEHLKELNLDYAGKVHLAIAMGLRPEHAKPLKALGSIRNRFAHRLSYQLLQSDTENLYKALSSDNKSIVQQAFERTKAQVSQSETKFRHMSPKDQFILLVVSLRAMMLVAVSEAERKRMTGA
jgi:hypothetical protein